MTPIRVLLTYSQHLCLVWSGGIDLEQTEQLAAVSSPLCGKGLLCEDPILMRSTLLENALVLCRLFLGSLWETKRFVGLFGSHLNVVPPLKFVGHGDAEVLSLSDLL